MIVSSNFYEGKTGNHTLIIFSITNARDTLTFDHAASPSLTICASTPALL